jgi:hypothetical protein
MPRESKATVAVLGIDIGKNVFHLIGLDKRGAIVLRQKLSRGQLEARLANIPTCLIGMEACVGAHHLSCKLKALGHDPRLPDTLVRDQRPSSPISLATHHRSIHSGQDRRAPSESGVPLRADGMVQRRETSVSAKAAVGDP